MAFAAEEVHDMTGGQPVWRGVRTRIGRALGRLVSGRSVANVEKVEDPIKEQFEKSVQAWLAARGDKTLRLDYDLTPKSTVLDLGGFEGQWASDIFSMYLCEVHVFEPVRKYSDFIANRFRLNSKIRVYPFGLGAHSRTESIAVAGDASSFVRSSSDNNEPIEIRAAAVFLNDYFPGTIDLIKINIEGAEYELLEHLIDAKVTERIRNIQVQFHTFVPDAPSRMRAIQERLALTHGTTYQYPFVWENWRRKA